MQGDLRCCDGGFYQPKRMEGYICTEPVFKKYLWGKLKAPGALLYGPYHPTRTSKLTELKTNPNY